jgi:hypothetical protein
MPTLARAVCTLGLLAALSAVSAPAAEVMIFEELFEDTDWESRGWYDGPHLEIAADEHVEGSGHACVWRWQKTGDLSPSGGGARVRFAGVDNVTLSFHIKHGADWQWTGVPYHPHEFHFITSADDRYVGPAYTHLTFYVEAVNGVPRLAIQDGRNIDEAAIGQDLTGRTEARSVAGCNGDSDGYGPGDCYRSGEWYVNGKVWEADQVWFGDEAGAGYKGDWHEIRARLRLNSVRGGIGQADGLLEYWVDGQLVIGAADVVFRTGQQPDILIDQFLMAPYFGPGVPHPQTIWIDDLRIFTDPDPRQPDTGVRGPDSTWGEVKEAPCGDRAKAADLGR